MPRRERANKDADAAAQGKVKRPRGAAPAGYDIWDGTPPGTWRNAAGDARPAAQAGGTPTIDWRAAKAKATHGMKEMRSAFDSVGFNGGYEAAKKLGEFLQLLRDEDQPRYALTTPRHLGESAQRIRAAEWTSNVRFGSAWPRVRDRWGFADPDALMTMKREGENMDAGVFERRHSL